jgi:hypothetical protein
MPGTVDHRARLVAYAIAAHADRDGLASVGSRQLVLATGMHSETIAVAIRRLEAAGMFVVTRTADRRSTYQFPTRDTFSTTARARAVRSGYPHPRGSGDKTARARAARFGEKHLDSYSDVIRAQHPSSCACSGGGFVTTIEHRDGRRVEVLARCPGPTAMEA